MREIKFRGERFETEDWVYGDLIRHYENQRRFIACDQLVYTYLECGIDRLVTERFYEVIPETVGQYTGLKDENGVEIYEGDVVFAEARFDCANMVVVWDKGSFVLVSCEKYKNYISGCGYKDIRWLTKTVIGNIYENPELTEG